MKKAYITIRNKATNKVANVIEKDSYEEAAEYCKKANNMFRYYNFSVEQ